MGSSNTGLFLQMTKKATKSITDITMTAQAEGNRRLKEVKDDGGRTWSSGEIVPTSTTTQDMNNCNLKKSLERDIHLRSNSRQRDTDRDTDRQTDTSFA